VRATEEALNKALAEQAMQPDQIFVDHVAAWEPHSDRGVLAEISCDLSRLKSDLRCRRKRGRSLQLSGHRRLARTPAWSRLHYIYTDPNAINYAPNAGQPAFKRLHRAATVSPELPAEVRPVTCFAAVARWSVSSSDRKMVQADDQRFPGKAPRLQ
jgi:hypothetical protein